MAKSSTSLWKLYIFFPFVFFLMCVTRQRKVQKKSSPRASPYYIFLVFNLTLFHCSYLFKYFIVTICTIINTKKVKAGNLADKNRHSAGREGRRQEVWTHDSYIFNRYMLLTSDTEDGAAVLKQDMLELDSSFLLENCSWGWRKMLFCAGQHGVAGWPLYCIFTLGRKTEARRWDNIKQCEGRLDTQQWGGVLKRCVQWGCLHAKPWYKSPNYIKG